MPLNKEIEKQIAENNQKISALLAENENLLRCAGLNPPAANAALPPEKKFSFHRATFGPWAISNSDIT